MVNENTFVLETDSVKYLLFSVCSHAAATFASKVSISADLSLTSNVCLNISDKGLISEKDQVKLF